MADLNKAGECEICGQNLTLSDPKRVSSDGSLVICPHHKQCDVRALRFKLARLKATWVYHEGE